MKFNKKDNSNIILNKELLYIFENISVIKYNKEDNELIIGDERGYIIIWNLESLGPKIIFKAHEKEITDIDYDNENKILISGSLDKHVYFWKIKEIQINKIDKINIIENYFNKIFK